MLRSTGDDEVVMSALVARDTSAVNQRPVAFVRESISVEHRAVASCATPVSSAATSPSRAP
jgi:hypothetical protein